MLRDMSVMHPAAKMLVDLSSAQDVEAGDGTTSVVVIAGSLLAAADRLLGKGTYWFEDNNIEGVLRVMDRPASYYNLGVVPKSCRCRRRNPSQYVTTYFPFRSRDPVTSCVNISFLENCLPALKPSWPHGRGFGTEDNRPEDSR